MESRRITTMLAALGLVALLISPRTTLAQSEPPPAQNLVDLRVSLEPPRDFGTCMILGKGTLTVTAKVNHDADSNPDSAGLKYPTPTFVLSGLMYDLDANLMMDISRDGSTGSTELHGGRYCWSLAVPKSRLPANIADMARAYQSAYAQPVDLLMTYQPAAQ